MGQDFDTLKYPIGKFQPPQIISRGQIEAWIETIEEFPEKVGGEVENLTAIELQKQYRPNGWTILQVVNHCADSHMNSFIRFKLALTEDLPTIKPYLENIWAELSDSKSYPIENSLMILEGLHGRWVSLMRNLTGHDLNRKFLHPESREKISLRTNIGIYAWHCDHHLAHIVQAKRS